MKNKPLIGLTGGIGSGKSRAADHFSELGISIVDADLASRFVVQKGQPALTKISDYFGPDILEQDGSLDRTKLRHIIFADQKKRKWLQHLLHPLTNAYLQERIAGAQSEYTILMNPLLIESRQYNWCNRVLVVDVKAETQIQRTMERDKNTQEQVEAIVKAQVTREKRLAHADDVIENEAAPIHLEKKITQLHKLYLTL